MSKYPHLEGLERLSPCCKQAVEHNEPFPDLGLVCAACGRPADQFLLRNVHGDIVWPVTVDLPAEPRKPRKKRRRRKPVEPDPSPYRLHLTGVWRTISKGIR